MSTLDGIPGSPVTKAGYAYQTLRRRILEGELQPGERLLLRPMAAELGLSVMPVRDAIRMLEGDGLVRTESHRGTSVAPIDPETVVELIGIRMWLEVLAVIEAAPLHTPETLAVVHERLAETEAAVHGDALVYARANRALHAAMNAPASEQLKSMMSDLFDRGWQARRGSSVYTLVPDTREQAQAGHVAIVRALDAGDADAAAAAAMAHRDATLRVWRTALAEHRPRPGAES